MEFRHEWKHEISRLDMLILRQRLRAVAQADRHAVDGKYQIRSLYFDTPTDKALLEKINGVSRREKFRIRYYNSDTAVIHLEKKSKLGGWGTSKVPGSPYQRYPQSCKANWHGCRTAAGRWFGSSTAK